MNAKISTLSHQQISILIWASPSLRSGRAIRSITFAARAPEVRFAARWFRYYPSRKNALSQECNRLVKRDTFLKEVAKFYFSTRHFLR
jgi:hypothetical protein